MNREGPDDEMSVANLTRRAVLTGAASGLVVNPLSTKIASAQQDERQIWIFELDSRVFSLAVADETIFVKGQKTGVLTVDTDTGDQKWAFETPNLGFNNLSVVDGTVFAGSNDNNVYAVDAKTGKKQWVFETGDDVLYSPAVADGKVFAGSWDNNLYALDTETGEKQWAFRTGASIFGGLTVADGTVFVGSQDHNLYAVDAESGVQKWAFKTDEWISSSPTVFDKTVFVGSADSNLYAIDSKTGEQLWKFETDNWVNDPLVVNETVFFSSEEGNSLYAVDAESGNKQWVFETEGSITSSQAVANRTLFFGTKNGYLYAVDAESGEQQWIFEASGSVLSLTVSDDKILFSGGRNIYAIDITENLTSKAPTTGIETFSLEDSPLSFLLNPLIAVAGGGAVLAPAVGYGLYKAYNNHQNWTDKLASQSIYTKYINNGTNRKQILKQIGGSSTIAKEKADRNRSGETIAPDRKNTQISNRANTEYRTKIPENSPSSPQVAISYNEIEKSEQLGSGGNADVYRATAISESGEIPLAVKEPRMAGKTVDADTIDMMLEEAETWQKLDDHEHIVSVIDFGSTPLPWIGMEYMDGGDLSGRADKLSFGQTLWTALAITRGVRYAHKRGVAHLDIKPSNILFQSVEDKWDVPKVADWGLSKHLLEHSGSVEGMSPRYAAPEQLDSEQFGQTDTVTDVYQLGIVLYELFTGEPPFDGQTYEVMNKIQSTTPDPPSDKADLPKNIDDILLTALATQREDRYDDMILLRNALQNMWDKYN